LDVVSASIGTDLPGRPVEPVVDSRCRPSSKLPSNGG